MREEDFGQFGQMLDSVCGLLSRGNYVPSAANTAMFFRALQRYSLDEVRAGFDAHLRDPERGRFVPVPADVIAQIDGLYGQDGRPGSDEAWAIAIESRDEFETVVWTAEIAQAMSAAKPVLEVGDKVGARFAFREAYERLVADARRNRQPCVWYPTLGHDQARRNAAIAEAVAAGRLRASDHEALPAPETRSLPQLCSDLAKAATCPQSARERLLQLRDEIEARPKRAEVESMPQHRGFQSPADHVLPPAMRGDEA